MRDALPAARDRPRLIGVGNALRGDDAAGLLAAERVRELEPRTDVVLAPRDVAALCDALAGVQRVVIVDALAGHGVPGELVRLDASERPLPEGTLAVSSHGLGVAGAIELARALGRLPPTVLVYGIRGAVFGVGDEPSAAVGAAALAAAASILRDLSR